MPAPIVNTAQASKGGAGLLQRQVETVLLWVLSSTFGCFSFFTVLFVRIVITIIVIVTADLPRNTRPMETLELILS